MHISLMPSLMSCVLDGRQVLEVVIPVQICLHFFVDVGIMLDQQETLLPK
jgi:hypothetical protein